MNQERIQKIIGILLVLYLSFISVATGISWLRTADTLEQALAANPYSVGGEVIALRTSGSGRDRNYYLRMSGFGSEIIIPDFVINPIYSDEPDASRQPWVNFASLLKSGDRIRVSVTQYLPFATGITREGEGHKWNDVLSARLANYRYRYALSHGKESGLRFLLLGITLGLGFVMGLTVSVFVAKRR